MLTESCVISFCRPEPFKASFCEIVYAKRYDKDSVNISFELLMNHLQETLYFLVNRSRRNAYLYFVYTRHRSMLSFYQQQTLTNVNFLNISQQFSFRGRQEHNQLKYGDFNIVITSTGKYVEWSVERPRKIAANERKFNAKMWATGHEERCPLMLFQEYIAYRPTDM